ncbi:hypothetical protein [Halovenus salina]|uniref:PH domain-containing protein n=1 Tax=Halovenus salina TaxID=1510225 RepID=A0ABD5W1G7_9EURY|nr:hypothetical protein [Halovenus salina]
MAETSNTLSQRADPTPDLGFRLAVGGYTGTVLAGVLVFGLSLAGIIDVAGLGVSAVVAFLSGAVLGILAIPRTRDGPERLGRSRLRYALVAPSLVLLAGTAVAWLLALGSTAVTVGVFATLLSASPAFLVVMMARSRYVRRQYLSSEAAVTWQATSSPAARRQRLTLSVVVLLGTGVLLAVDTVVSVGYHVLAPALGGIGGSLLGISVRTDRFRVYEGGIEIEHPASNRFIPWRQFEGYQVNDDELRLVRRWWPDHRHDLGRIDDPVAVVDALEDHLDCLGDEQFTTG